MLILGLFGLVFWWLISQREKTLTVLEDQKPVVEQQLYQIPDPNSRFSLSAVRQLPLHQWQPVPDINFGSSGGTGWVVSTLYNPTRQTVWMELQSHFIDSVNVWLVSGNEVIKEFPLTGYWRLPDATHNPTQHRYFLFELPLEAKQTYQVFIRGYVIPNFPQRYAIEYWEPAKFRNYQ